MSTFPAVHDHTKLETLCVLRQYGSALTLVNTVRIALIMSHNVFGIHTSKSVILNPERDLLVVAKFGMYMLSNLIDRKAIRLEDDRRTSLGLWSAES